MKSKDIEKIEEGLRKQIQRNPQDASLWNQLGECLIHQDRWEKAEIAYKEAVDLALDDPYHWLGLGLSLGAQSRWKESEVIFRQAIKMWSDNSSLWNGLGVALYEQGYQDESEAVFLKASQMPQYSHESNLKHKPNIGKEGIVAISFWRYNLQEGMKSDEFFSVSKSMIKS
jgi:cytochrome c-type biogenesis protein CcmH/NrfG